MNARANKEIALRDKQTFVNLQPPFNRKYDAWNDKLKTRLIETILLNRAMNPIWTVHNDEEHTEEVMDGVHRVTTSINFLNNQFAIKGVYLLDLPATDYDGKRFQDLSESDKNRVRQYNFFVNILDSSYMDEEKWQEMSELLNKSSKPMNDFEFKKPICNEFYEWLTPLIEPSFFKTTLFPFDKTSRGKLEVSAMKWIALSEPQLPEKFASHVDIMKMWQDRHLGKTKENVETFLTTQGQHYKDLIERIRKTQNKYVDEARLLDGVKEDAVAVTAIITRTVALVKDDARISRHLVNLTNKFKTQVLGVEISQVLECKGARNAEFQRKLLKFIDTIILEEIGNTSLSRCFPKAMILEVLREQNNLCAMCKEIIHPLQKYEGDHILGWIHGGETVKSNCQVVHQACHKRKT